MFGLFKKKPKVKAIEITAANFEELVLKSDKPVLLDFWASWCGPCKVIGPIIDEIARENQGRFVIGKVNTEVEQQLSAAFKIKSIPTLIFYNNGEPYARYSGLIPKPNIEELLVEMENLKA